MTKKRPSIAVGVTTFYADLAGTHRVRFECAQEQVRTRVAADDIVVVVDDSPTPTVAETLTSLGAHVAKQKGKGMAASKRESCWHASEFVVAAILLNEAEKPLTEEDIEKMLRLILTGEADVIVAERSTKSQGSFPPEQIESEKRANDAIEKIPGLWGIRPMMGPVMFANRPEVVACFMADSPANAKSGYAQHWGAARAQLRGYRVKRVDIDFQYPAAQRAEEENNPNIAAKRAKQEVDCPHDLRMVVAQEAGVGAGV